MVQGLIMGSMLAGTALVSTRLIQDQKKLQKTAESRDQIEQLHRLIYATVQNREHCRATLSTAGISTVTLGGSQAVNSIINKTASGSSQAIFEIHDGSMNLNKIYMNGNVVIQSMRFVAPTASDPNGLSYPSKLRIEYSRMESTDATKRTRVGFGAKRVKKDIPLILQMSSVTSTTATIDGCYAVQLGDTTNGITNEGNNNLNQEFCSKLGTNGSLYVWDSTANKCVLKNNVCPDKYVFAGIGSTGTAICYPLTDYLSNMVDTTSTVSCPSGAKVSLTTDASGKVKITCTP